MLRGNPPPPPTSLFFLFLSISFPSLFKKNSENFGGGGLNPPLKYALEHVPVTSPPPPHPFFFFLPLFIHFSNLLHRSTDGGTNGTHTAIS